MKRAPTMRNAPQINLNDIPVTPRNDDEHKPSAPAVANLSDRVRGMTGNHITLPVCGRDVSFKLETVKAEMVDKATMVWSGNERVQSLLTKDALDDLIPSFLTSGQQNPAFGRNISGIIEVADGSRRRQTAIYTHSEYRVLVGELDDEQMAWLSQIGNDYRQTSSYERGKRYARRLANEFGGTVSKLAEAESISRKVIMRCIKTSELPQEIISLFRNPNELSARAGEGLAKVYIDNKDAIFSFAQNLMKRKSAGEQLETEEIITQLHSIVHKPVKSIARERLFGKGIKAKYSGDAVSFQLQNVPSDVVKKIEELLVEYQESQQKKITSAVDNAFIEIDAVTCFIRKSAESISYNISTNEIQSLIPFGRTILNTDYSYEDKVKEMSEKINNRYVI